MSTLTKLWLPGALRSHTFLTPRFTVAPFLPHGGICVLHGPPGVGKSQLALTLARDVARGQEFLTPEHPTTQGKVLYIQVNMPIQEQQSRLLVTDIDGKDEIAFLSLEFGMLDSERLIPANDKGLRDAKTYDPDLVIVDTLRDVHTLEEIDSATVTRVYGAWRQLFPQSTLLFVHHDRKLPLPQGKHGNVIPERYWLEAARGSSTWLGNADSGLHLTDAKGALTLSFSKTRTCAPIAPYAVRLAQGTLLVELTTPTARQRLMGWAQANPKGTHAEAVKHLMDEAKISKQRANQLVNEVLGSGK
ncbi:MAG: AAA family ATPase [Acidobacteriales bacterium]|nr:AAA family ATPase [Terriglobales bacterium]